MRVGPKRPSGEGEGREEDQTHLLDVLSHDHAADHPTDFENFGCTTLAFREGEDLWDHQSISYSSGTSHSVLTKISNRAQTVLKDSSALHTAQAL